MIKIYSIFHFNLMYSSIETEERERVIKKCYWPLLEVITKSRFKAGIEITGCTLEIINDIDKNWIHALTQLIDSKQVELIGSGYSQLIGPLVPFEINDRNQALGLKTYASLLNSKPRIALVNEMAFSKGLVEHYIKHGYEGIIMEWNNPRSSHPEWENDWRYYPQYAEGNNDLLIPVIWADSIAFQKFQRYAHGESDIHEYLNYLNSHNGNGNRFFPLYSNDIEIFDYRPGRYKTESRNVIEKSEWNRISTLFKTLLDDPSFDVILPSENLNGLEDENGGHTIQLESPDQPVPVKKQQKYNITRWALTGRNDLGINTDCYSLYHRFLQDQNDSESDWKELCYLWSSDFRTHITEKRWKEYLYRMQKFKLKIIGHEPLNDSGNQSYSSVTLPYTDELITCTKRNKILKIENDNLLVQLNTKKGLTIKHLYFKGISENFIIGTLEHGFFDDISLGADFFSGHSVLEKAGKHKITDLNEEKADVFRKDKNILIKSRSDDSEIFFNKRIWIEPSIIRLEKEINTTVRQHEIIRPFHITFNPVPLDEKSLYFATHNGGKDLEYFKLGDSSFQHHRILSPLISSVNGLGATFGKMYIGDKNVEIIISHEQSISALIPAIEYQHMKDGKFFLRLVYSAQEIDETFRKQEDEQSIYIKFEITFDQKY